MSIEEKSVDVGDAIPTLDDGAPGNQSQWGEVVQNAIKAERFEKSMSLWDGLRLYPKAVFWSMAVSMTLVMEGFDTNMMGNMLALPSFRQRYGRVSASGGYQLDPAWQSAVGYAPAIGNIIGIFVFSWMQQQYGYRRTMQLNLILITGFIFIVFFANSIQVLFVGELLCGLPWGAFSSSAVSYASEVTPVPLRGFVSLCWIMGQFISSGTIYATHNWTSDLSYKLPFALQWIWPLPLFILVTLAPESPWFLIRQKRYDEAEKSIRQLSVEDETLDAKQTVAMMIRTNQQEEEINAGTSYWDCFKGADLRRTEIACVAWASTVLVGSSFANHPAYFLEQAGFSTSDALQLDLGLRALAFVGTLVSWVNMTLFGRRKTMLVGELVLATSLLLTGILSVPGDHNQNAAWAESAMIFVWVFTWDAAVTTTAYAIVGEVPSTRLRGKTVGLARNLYNVAGLVGGIINTYSVNPDAWNWKGRAAFFWLGSCLLAMSWAYFRLPECKGRTFREIDIMFARKVPARKFERTLVEEEGGEVREA
ncbi:hypothetical protein EHS25_007049 [Saitozyma podzolica]|uniref:Major facilitator superfamily (MFS) profile domain-containing protein n=1 Tax=Saitozyma podzolica TaxID=1890683 RepID=A0A427XPF3_9TREE|nr:hypothetical protein EHS25_007049 [Saitozyma podzolica]